MKMLGFPCVAAVAFVATINVLVVAAAVAAAAGVLLLHVSTGAHAT
jgi:hypothetical protein